MAFSTEKDRSQSLLDLSEAKIKRQPNYLPYGCQETNSGLNSISTLRLASSTSSLKIYSLNSSAVSVISDQLAISRQTIPEQCEVAYLRLSADGLEQQDFDQPFWNRSGTTRRTTRPVSFITDLNYGFSSNELANQSTQGSNNNAQGNYHLSAQVILAPANSIPHFLMPPELSKLMQGSADGQEVRRCASSGSNSSLAWVDVKACQKMHSQAPNVKLTNCEGEESASAVAPVSDENNNFDYEVLVDNILERPADNNPQQESDHQASRFQVGSDDVRTQSKYMIPFPGVQLQQPDSYSTANPKSEQKFWQTYPHATITYPETEDHHDEDDYIRDIGDIMLQGFGELEGKESQCPEEFETTIIGYWMDIASMVGTAVGVFAFVHHSLNA